MRGFVYILVLIFAVIPAFARAEPCRLALVLALDVSGSVNETEYAQQLNGLSYALNNDDVRAAILKNPDTPVHLSVFEWSSRNHQFLVQPWIVLDSHDAIDNAVARIRAYRKKRAGLKTALSTAMLFAGELLRDKRACWQKTIDVSGDGKNNIGPAPARVYALDVFADITVNALVVGNPASTTSASADRQLTRHDLMLYFEDEVIHGPAAFAMIAYGYEDFARAMQQKLLRELSPQVLSASEY